MLLPYLKPTGIHSLDVPGRIVEEVMQLLALATWHQRGEDRHRFVVLPWQEQPDRAVWLPYVEVDRIEEITERARALGALVLLEPREGPTGWRAVVSTSAGGEIALWRPKR